MKTYAGLNGAKRKSRTLDQVNQWFIIKERERGEGERESPAQCICESTWNVLMWNIIVQKVLKFLRKILHHFHNMILRSRYNHRTKSISSLVLMIYILSSQVLMYVGLSRPVLWHNYTGIIIIESPPNWYECRIRSY